MWIEILCFAGGYSLCYIVNSIREELKKQKKVNTISLYEFSKPQTSTIHTTIYYEGGKVYGKSKIERKKGRSTKTNSKSKKG